MTSSFLPPRPPKPKRAKAYVPRNERPCKEASHQTESGWQCFDKRGTSPVRDIAPLLLVKGDADSHLRLALNWAEMAGALPSILISTYLMALSESPTFSHEEARHVALRRLSGLSELASVGPSVRERMNIAHVVSRRAADDRRSVKMGFTPEIKADAVELGLTVTAMYCGELVPALDAAARYTELIILGADGTQWKAMNGYLPYAPSSDTRQAIIATLLRAIPKIICLNLTRAVPKKSLSRRLAELSFDGNPPLFRSVAMLKARRLSLPEPEVWVDVGIPKPFKTSQVRNWLAGPDDVHLINTPA